MTTNEDQQEPTLDVAGGDPAVSRHLRDCLRLLRGQNDDPDFRRLVDDVLSGRRGLRDAYRAPEFTDALDVWVGRFARRYDQLSEEEVARLAADGDRYFDDLREQITNQDKRP